MRRQKELNIPDLAVRLTVLGAALAVLVGCTTYFAPVKPPQGVLFTDIKAPLTVNFNRTPCGAATKKFSKSNTSFFFDFIFTWSGFAWDDVSVGKIAREGGISEIAYADYEALLILGVFGKTTVNVYGN